MNINIQELIKACDTVYHRTTKICGTHHGSSWLFDKLMRYFESEPSAVSVDIPIFLNAPIMRDGVATIGRDGSLTMAVLHKLEV